MPTTRTSSSLEFLRDLPPSEEPQFWEVSTGRRLAWNEYGDPNGFPVMYYHGWPSSRLQARLVHHLAHERCLRIIAMDRPGIGRSTFEPQRTLDSWPRLIEQFANALQIEKFGQLGVSGGGPYVLACAARIPERVVGSVVLGGAVLIEETLGGLRGLHPAYRLLIPLRKLPGAWFSPMFRLTNWAARLNLTKPPLSWALLSLGAEDRELLLKFPDLRKVLTESFSEAIRSSAGCGVMADAEIYFQSLGIALNTVHHPIRYWHGGDDRNIPVAMVREFTRKIAGAELVVDEELGHFSLVIRRSAAALDYLAKRAAEVPKPPA